MKRETLHILKSIATWLGVGVTLGGIIYNVVRGGDIVGAYISLGGVFITSLGNLIGNALAKHDKIEKQQLEERLQQAEEFTQEFGDIADDAPYLRKVISKQKDEDFIRAFNGDDWK